jgi:hypothetical protein
MTDENQEQQIVPTSPSDLLFPLAQDSYADIQLSTEAKQRLANILVSSRAGLVSSSPLICRGPESCPFISRCPIYGADGNMATYPLDRQCIVEVNLIQDRFMAYAEELDVQGKMSNSLTYRSQVSALVDLDLREFRTVMILSGVGGFSDGTLLYEQTIAINEDNEEVKQLQEHPAFRNLLRLRKDRMELLDAMGLTVRRKAMMDAALHKKDADNFLTRSLEVLDRIANLEEALIEEK